ncbi:hypothetical protein GLOTRDRAFT_139515 [Gloeophyllum trabeum ATCC 11539]|uniref:PHD-type domain-containing protein n=1 Tax=Gloeophyllum trabeum (strain ATCC 11539 / FP-39264 / Madison 617) TaxID=670483 RepID=S7RIH9_GLOTA|nr:uncharacterized protein GLOTRDRAFT_139515 [Gloeophyllum trabeum ATCC 11539]EPQ54130.1 hypothetical protein GLOTRDRAFT_139515 [Gloeophyllum trabeum ATCC 11539]
MARRTVTASTRASAIASPTPHPTQTPVPSSSNPDLALLRRQWKWAAFSQLFYTFSRLFAVDDVTLTDIEEDLVHSRAIVLPRIMARLLGTLSGDRKTNLDNWQSALRRQYMRRKPEANPIGPEPPRTSGSYEEPYIQLSSRLQSTAEPEHEPKVEDAEDPVPESAQKDTGPSSDAMDGRTDGRRTEAPSSPAPSSSEAKQGHPVDSANTSSPATAAEQPPSKDWLDLPMLEKLESMHTVVEWHFDHPARLRKIMRDDDEGANWRIEPIGYDSKANAYWLIGPDRLWIQRVPPKPPRPPKRKRAPAKSTTRKGKQAQTSRAAEPAYEEEEEPEEDVPASKAPRTRGSRATRQTKSAATPATPGPRKGDRAAKRQANIKLDAQAKAFEEYQRQAALDAKQRPTKRQKTERSPTKAPPRPTGTRVSSRLRGSTVDEEWQQVPEEWLKEDEEQPVARGSVARRTRGAAAAARATTGLESDADSISELTSLSDEQEDRTLINDEQKEPVPEPVPESADVAKRSSERVQPELPADFVEWEAICVTLYEWEHVAEQFAGSNHYAEKALYKRLVNDIVPAVTAELREIERKKKLEEAIVHRKRSSRIATKESVREQARMEAERRAEEEKALARAKRAEARQKQEEESRRRREEARERRRKEREEKEQKALQEEVQQTADSSSKPNGSAAPTHDALQLQDLAQSSSGTTSGIQTPSGSDWEVHCEVCRKRGINIDNDVPLVQCEVCKKWQHQQCHDRVDEANGRRRRNWNHPDYHFMCQACQPTPSHTYATGSGQHSASTNPGYPSKNITLQWNHSRSSNVYPSPATGTLPYPGTGSYIGNPSYAPLNGHSHYPPPTQPGPVSGSQQFTPIQFDYYQPPQHSVPANPGPSQYNQSSYGSPYGSYMQPALAAPAPLQGQIPSARWNTATPATNGYHTNGYPPIEPRLPPSQALPTGPRVDPRIPAANIQQSYRPQLQPRQTMDFTPS